MKIPLAILGFIVLAAHGAEPVSTKTCTTIKENAKRLACFDAARKAELSLPTPPPPQAATTLVPLEVKELRLGMNTTEVDAIVPGFSKTCGKNQQLNVIRCTHTIPIVPTYVDVMLKTTTEETIKRLQAQADAYPKLKTFADAPVKNFTVQKRDDMVASISLSLNNSSWLIVTQALMEKYGKPFSKESGTVQNRAGATFDQEKIIWRNGDQYVVAEKRTSQLDTMSIGLRSDKGDSETVEAVKDIVKKGAKDL